MKPVSWARVALVVGRRAHQNRRKSCPIEYLPDLRRFSRPLLVNNRSRGTLIRTRCRTARPVYTAEGMNQQAERCSGCREDRRPSGASRGYWNAGHALILALPSRLRQTCRAPQKSSSRLGRLPVVQLRVTCFMRDGCPHVMQKGFEKATAGVICGSDTGFHPGAMASISGTNACIAKAMYIEQSGTKGTTDLKP